MGGIEIAEICFKYFQKLVPNSELKAPQNLLFETFKIEMQI